MNTPAKMSMTNRAYQEIKRRILENEIQPNAIFLEQELAELLNMSRTPIREALIRLSNEGMVEVRPRHGMRVLPVSAQDMLDIYDILTALEAQAVELVATNGLNEEQLKQLHHSVDKMDNALAENDLISWNQADERFHRLLVEYSDNNRLSNIVKTYWDQSHRVRVLTLHLRPKPVNSNKDHRKVVEAIETRNPEIASKQHREHRRKNGKVLFDLLKKHDIASL